MSKFTTLEQELLHITLLNAKIKWRTNKKIQIEDAFNDIVTIFNLHITDVYNLVLDYICDTCSEKVVINEIENLVFGE